MQRSPTIESQMFPDSKNDRPTAPGIKYMSLACMQASAERLSKNVERKISEQKIIKKMSLAYMQESCNRLSKNFERKMAKPIIKKESKVNVNDKQIKKVPRRSVFEVTKTRLLVPLTPETARLKHQCIHENTADTVSCMPSKKDATVQTVPLALSQQQSAEMSSTDGNPPQPLSRKTLNNYAPFKEIVKKFDTFLRKNMKTTILFKKYADNLSARRIVAAAAFTHDYWKYLMYFSTFSIGVITTYLLNYLLVPSTKDKNTQHLLK